jgi:hypothetical protein
MLCVQRVPLVNTGEQRVNGYLLSIAYSNLREYKKRYFVAAEIGLDVVNKSTPTQLPTLTGYFRGDAYHAIAVSLALVDQTQMRFQTTIRPTIDVINHPLPRQPNTVVKDKVAGVILVI